MDDLVSAASALANLLVKGRSLPELQRLQIALQVVGSIVAAKVLSLRA